MGSCDNLLHGNDQTESDDQCVFHGEFKVCRTKFGSSESCLMMVMFVNDAMAAISVLPFGVPTNADRLPALVIFDALLSQAEMNAERSVAFNRSWW